MISPNAYEEVYEILGFMDKLTVMKIPKEILENIDKRRNLKYQSKIDKNDIFNKQNMSDEALELLCYIDYNYWMDESKKVETNKILREREIEIEQEKRKKYNPDNIFKNKLDAPKIIMEPQNKEKNTELIEYNQKWYQKIFTKILKLLKKG